MDSAGKPFTTLSPPLNFLLMHTYWLKTPTFHLLMLLFLTTYSLSIRYMSLLSSLMDLKSRQHPLKFCSLSNLLLDVSAILVVLLLSKLVTNMSWTPTMSSTCTTLCNVVFMAFTLVFLLIKLVGGSFMCLIQANFMSPVMFLLMSISTARLLTTTTLLMALTHCFLPTQEVLIPCFILPTLAFLSPLLLTLILTLLLVIHPLRVNLSPLL